MNVYVCVRLSARISQKPQDTRPVFAKLSARIAYVRGSVCISRRCETLCTSGLGDYVIFSYNGLSGIV